MNLDDFKKEKRKHKKRNYSRKTFFVSLFFLFISAGMHVLSKSANITLDMQSEGVRELVENEQFSNFIPESINKVVFLTKLEPISVFALVISAILFIVSILARGKNNGKKES